MFTPEVISVDDTIRSKIRPKPFGVHLHHNVAKKETLQSRANCTMSPIGVKITSKTLYPDSRIDSLLISGHTVKVMY